MRRARTLVTSAAMCAIAHAGIGAQSTIGDSSSTPATGAARSSADWQPYLLGTQINVITQRLAPVRSPYAGTNSLKPNGDTKTSHAYGVYAGVQAAPWLQGYLDVEMIRGEGINRATGLAGITNGDVVRQGSVDLGNGPYLARGFVRITRELGGAERDTLGRAADQIPSVVSSRRLELAAGKLAVSDVFDLNRYANTTRWQYMNWGLFQNSAWDYAADTRGYSNGVAISWIHPAWILRAGSFQMPTFANGNHFDPDLRRARGDEAELTVNVSATGTVVRTLAYLNHARMGNYAEAIAIARASGTTPDIVADDKPGRTKYGYGLNIEQPLADGGETGLFARLGWSDGANESFVFTEVDRAASIGVQISGARWGRAADRIGIAGLAHGIATGHQQYLAAGGLGFLLGDGGLTYGREEIIEAFYRGQISEYIQIGPDVQYIRNPGYNRDRGPATVLGLRLNLRY
jgi:high affinity Mn2+ porin